MRIQKVVKSFSLDTDVLMTLNAVKREYNINISSLVNKLLKTELREIIRGKKKDEK